MMLFGCGLISLGTYLYQSQAIPGIVYLMLASFGTNIVYAPAGFILYDRLVAATRTKATSSFLINLSDVVGQLAGCGVVAYHEFAPTGTEDLDFFVNISYGTSGGLAVLIVLSAAYFTRRLRQEAAKEFAPGRPRLSSSTGPDKELQCKYCSHRFSNGHALKIHTRDVHLAVPSWHNQPTQLKMAIMQLTNDRRNFTRRLSGNVASRAYDHALHAQMARSTIAQQPALQRVFDQCVPELTTEAKVRRDAGFACHCTALH